MKRFYKLLWVVLILGSFVASSVPVNAGAYVYAGKRKKINCAVVGINGATQPFTGTYAVGNLFYLLDQRIDMKPSGWSFENPLAPGSPSTGLPKSNPAYWVIDLSSVRDLSMMNVLYLPASNAVALSDYDREKLRKFVDGGGVLWIDNADTGQPLTFTTGVNDTFFIKDVAFETAGTGFDYPASRHHPLLTVPYWITEPEIMNLGSYWGQCNIRQNSVFGNDEPFEFDVLLPVVSKGSSLSGAKTSIGALAYGSGRIVATSNFIGRGCFMNYPYNLPSLKFAYNVIAWASSWTHLRKDPRHSGASIDTVGGTRLINMWTLPGLSPSLNVDSAPVIYKNVVFYSCGTRVYALDLRPQDDLDQDGNPDDGIQGLPSGMPDKGQDIIWVWDCPDGLVSSPTVVSARDPVLPTPPDTTVKTIDAVLVMSSAGTVYMLNAFPTVAPGAPGLAPATNLLPLGSGDRWATGAPLENPYPPLYENGWIYAVAGDGLLYAYSPALENWIAREDPTDPPPYKWELPTKQDGQNTLMATPRSGPSFGYVENDGGGTLVGMVYWFTSVLKNPNDGGGPGEKNDHILGVPVMVSKDRLKIKRTVGAKVECQVTYTEGFVSPIPKPRIWYRNASGTMDEADPANVIPNKDSSDNEAKGTITFTPTGTLPPGTLIYANYSLIYGNRTDGSGTSTLRHIYSPRIRQPLEPRTGTSSMPATEIAGIPAMGPNSMIYVNGKRDLNPNYGGSVYGIFNDGNTQMTKWHYFLHSGMQSGIPGTSAEGFPIPGAITDEYNAPMMSPMPYSSPVVSGDKLFATVAGANGGPKGALLCFKANSDFVIRITENAGFGNAGAIRKPKRLISDTTNREMLVKVWQPNLLANTSVAVNPLIEAVPVPKDMIDYEKGTITIDNFDRLKIRAAGDPTTTNTLSPSLPVWVFLDNVEVPIDFSTWGPSKGMDPTMETKSRDAVDLSGWNNLLWYYLIPDSTVHNSPVVIGDTVYVVADNGKVYALDTETGETASTMTAQKPIWEDTICNAFAGTQNTSVAGSNGVLLIPGSDGLYAYTDATTLTTDSNRIAEIDGAGELSWALDSIMWPESLPPTNDPPAVRTGPINKPARVKYIGTGDLLLVNSGANQVARIDKSGIVGIERFKNNHFVRWMFDRFTDPRHLLRPGQTTRLQSPTDAILWQEVEGTELVVHCVVADSGNHRVVDLVYRSQDDVLQNSDQDPESGYYLPELNWVSKTESANDRYIYNSLQMVPVYTGSSGSQVLSGHNIWAAISTHHTGTDDPMVNVKDMGRGGAVVALKYRVKGSSGWNYSYEDPNPTGYDSGTIVAACDRVVEGGRTVLLSNPRCFELFQDKSSGETRLLVADDNGVFEASLASNPPAVVGSIFTDDAYRKTIRLDPGTPIARPIGAPLVANSVQRLPNNNWLITNGFLGMYRDARNIDRKFTGEVFELEPSTGKIVWCSPKLTSIPPVDWKQSMDNSYMIQQPRSAFRRY